MSARRLLLGTALALAFAFSATLGYHQLVHLRLLGKYERIVSPASATTGGVQQLEVTWSRLILYVPGAGPLAQEYSLADEQIYLGTPPAQVVFTIDGLGIISNHGTAGLEGTYLQTR